MTHDLVSRRPTLTALFAAGVVLATACSADGTLPNLGGSSETGTVTVKLTDAPFPTDQVKSVDVFVVRVDGRTSDVTEADADQDLDNQGSTGWRTIATPNASFNLLSLQNGATATLGTAPLGKGTYSGLRLIIDASQSSVTLKDGTKLTGSSNPGVMFPSASRSGLKINLSQPLVVVGGATTTLLVDFDVANSFVMRGNTIQQNGLLFKPVINGSVIDAATVNANIRLANATASALDFVQGTAALTGGSNLAFGTSSTCASVTAATPNLSVRVNGTTTALPGFTPTLQAGTSYTVVAYPSGANTAFATLTNTFTPTAGQAGLRVFNASGFPAAFDAYVTTSGAPLGTATLSNVLNASSSAFVSVPAGSQQIRLTATGLTVVLLDMGTQTLTAGQNYTLVIAPPASGQTAPRAFLVAGC
ncbi:MAG TPA: DUF4382 domain-containing protein [Gemmatimonadaceae bacterium]